MQHNFGHYSAARFVPHLTYDSTHQVHKVISGGLADRDGRIRKSDRILSINGKTMKNVTHKDAIDILKSPRQEVVLVISRDGRQSVRTTPNISRASSLSSVLDVVDEPEVTATAATESQQTPVPVKNGMVPRE